MRKFFSTLLMGSFLFSADSFALAVVTVEGKIASDTKEKIGIETADRIYYVAKAKLTPAQLEHLKKKPKKVSLSVPISSFAKIEIK